MRKSLLSCCFVLLAAIAHLPVGAVEVVAVYYPHWHVYPKGDEWFHPGWTEWEYVKEARPRFPGHRQPMIPAVGYLDGKNPADVAKEIDLAADAGVNVFLYDYYYYGGRVTQEEAIEEGFLRAANRHRMKFALMWCYHDRGYAWRRQLNAKPRFLMTLERTPEEFLGLVDLSIERYFHRPEYWRKEGRLFFSIYNAKDFIAELGVEKARGALDEARRRIRAAGLGEVEFNAQNPKSLDDAANFKAAGFDSLTHYAGKPVPDLASRYAAGERLFDYRELGPALKERYEMYSKADLPYYPSVSVGWDSTPRCRIEEPFPWQGAEADYPYTMTLTNCTAALLEENLRQARAFAENDAKHPNVVYVNAWNEYTEGCYLLPDNFEGDARLRAVRNVFKPAAGLRVERRKPLTANVGIVSVGLDTYWKQCPGLLDDMKKKEDVFVKKCEAHQVKVSRFGMSDNPIAAKALIPAMKAADLDILFVDMVTYATSSTFAPFVRELNCPIVLFALQPDNRLDYEHATIYKQLLNDDLCSVPEFTGVAERYGKPVADVVIGKLTGDAKADEEIRQWCAVAHVLHDLRRARIGLMGHVLEAMYDMQVDPTAVSRTFGCHVSLCEPDEIVSHYQNPDAHAVAAMKKRILSFFDTPDPVSDPWTEKLTDRDLDVAAKAAVALEGFAAKRQLDGFAYYYEGLPGTVTRELVTNFIVGNSLLTAAGFPMCGEFDLKNCIAMMIFDRLEIGGSFAEFHPIDFGRDTVLVGHDGPHHLNIAQSKPVLRSLKKYHGKPGKGAGVEFNIKEGPITMMSIGVKRDGAFKFVVAEGESLKGPIPPTGNTNTHGKFPPDVRTFLRKWSLEGPTHHFALGIGHHAAEIKKLGRALNVETVVVTPSDDANR